MGLEPNCQLCVYGNPQLYLAPNYMATGKQNAPNKDFSSILPLNFDVLKPKQATWLNLTFGNKK